jgi:metal-responsive CopG/Arc/MetJ family transcriptional regulator
VGVTINKELLDEIEEVRGIVKRSTFVEELLKLGLKAYRQQESNRKHE